MINKTHRILFLTLAFLIITGSAEAQREKPENLPKYDLAPYHFGFILGMNQMFFSLKTVKEFEHQDSILGIHAQPELGFNIGIVSNLRLADYWDLRFIPTLSFGERTMVFTRALHDTIYFDTKKKVESTYLEFPLEIKFKGRRIQNARPYILTGVKYSIDLASQAKKKEQDEEIRVKLKKNDVAIEVGVGFDFYTTYFKFGTELKMSYGFIDMLKHEENIYTGNIDKLRSKVFMLIMTFE